MDMFSAIKAINHRLMYIHAMTIWRKHDTKDKDGSTKQVWEVEATAVPCKLSKKDLDKGGDIKEDANPIRSAFMVFCDPEADVKAGDRLEIGGLKYLAGEPFAYPAQQEISVSRRDWA